MKVFNIIHEPTGPLYCALLDLLASRAETFSVVWRGQLDFSKNANRLTQDMKPYLEQEHMTNRWPGTILMGHKATVRKYRITPESLEFLKATKRLYAWLAPDFPEDLAFYDSNNNCIFGSISHEKDAFVSGTVFSKELLTNGAPGLAFDAGEIEEEFLT